MKPQETIRREAGLRGDLGALGRHRVRSWAGRHPELGKGGHT